MEKHKQISPVTRISIKNKLTDVHLKNLSYYVFICFQICIFITFIFYTLITSLPEAFPIFFLHLLLLFFCFFFCILYIQWHKLGFVFCQQSCAVMFQLKFLSFGSNPSLSLCVHAHIGQPFLCVCSVKVADGERWANFHHPCSAAAAAPASALQGKSTQAHSSHHSIITHSILLAH